MTAGWRFVIERPPRASSLFPLWALLPFLFDSDVVSLNTILKQQRHATSFLTKSFVYFRAWLKDCMFLCWLDDRNVIFVSAVTVLCCWQPTCPASPVDPSTSVAGIVGSSGHVFVHVQFPRPLSLIGCRKVPTATVQRRPQVIGWAVMPRGCG